jgi:hypothetical protein
MHIGSVISVLKELLNQHPLLIAFDILAAMAALGCVWMLMRETVLFRGYRSLKGVAKSMAYALDGSTFRDGEDLVINGFYRGVPTVARFSFAENTPEVDLWMKVGSALTMWVTHKSVKLQEGRMRVPTRDSWFDDRFVIRTDNPNDAVAFLTDDRAFGELKKLCCSPGTAIALSKDSLELSELTIPVPNTFKHLMAHLESMAEMAVRVGALSVLKSKTKIYRPDRYLIARAALVALVLAGVAELYSAATNYGKTDDLVAAAGANTGDQLTTDELRIPGREQWRVATADDFDPMTVSWMREHGTYATGRMHAMFNGAGQPSGTGYIFVRKNANAGVPWRVVLMTKEKRVYDTTIPGLAAAVVIPRNSVVAASSQNPNPDVPEPAPDGDGLMVISHQGDANIATILYLSDGKLATKISTDYLGLLTR